MGDTGRDVGGVVLGVAVTDEPDAVALERRDATGVDDGELYALPNVATRELSVGCMAPKLLRPEPAPAPTPPPTPVPAPRARNPLSAIDDTAPTLSAWACSAWGGDSFTSPPPADTCAPCCLAIDIMRPV